MELFRHYFTGEEWGTSIFQQQHLNDFGFCNMDGSVITGNWNTPGLQVRYKLDSRAEVSLKMDTNKSMSPSFQPILSNNPTASIDTIRWYNDESYAVGWETKPVTVFFIPLINKGFFLHLRSHNDRDAGKLSQVSNDQRDKTFDLNTPTPNLNIKVYGTGKTDGSAINGKGMGVLNFIGVPPSTGNLLHWTYLIYTSNEYFNGNPRIEDSSYTHHLIDYGGGRVIDIPFRSGYTRDYNSGNPISENNLTYTNVNANVCSLIKMPFDTGYIDNIYLLATAPKSLEDGTFFSFNGRNFLNVFENYVLELPST